MASTTLALTARADGKMAAASGHVTSPEINYMLHCQGCHGHDGVGLPAAGVPDFNNLIGSFSRTQAGRTYIFHVPGVITAGLPDLELAYLINYIMRRWGGSSLQADFHPFTAKEVSLLRKVPIDDVVKYRKNVVSELKEQGLPVAPYPWP